jgi:hypothetical protein
MVKERYVSFLDILGFSDKVMENNLDSMLEKFKIIINFMPYVEALGQWINFNDKITPGNKKCSCFSFSDTFVLSTEDASLESFKTITIATFILARNLFGVGFPVRGAITKGEADYIPNTNHLIGKAIINAAKLEKQQDWFGIILSKDVLSDSEIIPSGPIRDILIKYEVPFKDSSNVTSLVINWRLNLFIKYGTKSIFSSSSEPENLRKISNTLKFAKYVRDSGLAYIDVKEKWQHSLYVSDTDPTQKTIRHGDEF